MSVSSAGGSKDNGVDISALPPSFRWSQYLKNLDSNKSIISLENTDNISSIFAYSEVEDKLNDC